jgi:putative hemolysin
MFATGSRIRTFPELSYANEHQHPLMRWCIRTIEDRSGRDRLVSAYAHWSQHIVPRGERVFGAILDLIGLKVETAGHWPPAPLPDGPLVIIANHPFGIGDGVSVLSLAEQLGRPFRVLVASDLLKVPEMASYALPVDFSETKEAVQRNIEMRHEAVRLLKAGVTIVVFPAGGVATAPKGFGKAEDLPWKIFPSRLIQDARANVLPLYVPGQNGRLFHLVSRAMHLSGSRSRFARLVGKASLTLRLSILVSEFVRLAGRSMAIRVGAPIKWDDISAIRDRKELLRLLERRVFELEAKDL